MSGVWGVKSGICALAVADSAQAVSIIVRIFIRSPVGPYSQWGGELPLIWIKKLPDP
jgi:hypothetical protein